MLLSYKNEITILDSGKYSNTYISEPKGVAEMTNKTNSWVARDVIIFENPKLESHQSYYLHQA